MSTQDKLERVLRDIHVLISRSELYDKTGEKIIVEKKQMFEQLKNLNGCIYEMMDEYEVTQQSRDKAEREAKKQGDKIIWNASRSAEDIYAAAVLYTDEALTRAQEIMKNATESVAEILAKTQTEMDSRKSVLKENQSELKSQLQNMVDTEKYLKIIDERNKEIEKERQEKLEGKDKITRERRLEKSIYDGRKTEIKINPEYFEKLGKSLEQEDAELENTENAKSEEAAVKAPATSEQTEKAPQIKVDLDAEYFKWKKVEKKQG